MGSGAQAGGSSRGPAFALPPSQTARGARPRERGTVIISSPGSMGPVTLGMKYTASICEVAVLTK